MSKIQTSTPIIFPKSESLSSRKSWLNQDVTQQLYRNTWAKFKSPVKSSWDSIEGPKFVDFNGESVEIRDSFFDGKEQDCPSPQGKEEMILPRADEAMEIVQSLNACSISTIGNESSEVEDETLIGEESLKTDDTLRAVEKTSERTGCDRRSSIARPFSFELREKENQERRESRRAYYKMLTEKMTPQSFKAKPVPNFIRRLSVAGKSELSTETPHRRVIRVPREEKVDLNPPKLPRKIEKTKSAGQMPKTVKIAPNSVQTNQKSGRTGENPFQVQQKSKSASNPFQFQRTKNSPLNLQFPKSEKRSKPFQVVLPSRKIEPPKSPQLMTARRARERQIFEEKLRERELQRLEMKKQAEAAQRAKEAEEIARLRKMTVFKARPVPQFKNPLNQVTKRPLTEAMIPIFTKRRRCL